MNKIDAELSLETAFRLTYDLSKRGKVIGFTHGAFDLLHYGHAYMLSQAAKQCDFLVVALDADETVKSLKGADRPVISEEQRCKLLNSLSFVGNAFVNDLTPSNKTFSYLAKELHANFIAIGRKYPKEKEENAVARQLRIPLVKYIDDFNSTSRIIAKIRN